MTVSRLVVIFALASMGSGCFRRVPQPEPPPQPAQAEDYALAFINGGYGWCDAQVLAWNYGPKDIYEAKVYFGRMISDGQKIGEKLAASRSQAKSAGATPCDYYESSFGYDDAEVLANSWGVQIDEAKTRIGQLLSWHGEWAVHDQLKGAYRGLEGNEHDAAADPLMAFWNSDLTTCDAELISQYWGISFYDAKMELGDKVLWGLMRDDLEQGELGAAREHARAQGTTCSWWGSDLNMDELEQLACFFGVDVGEMKGKAATAAFEGRVSDLRAALPQAAACTR